MVVILKAIYRITMSYTGLRAMLCAVVLVCAGAGTAAGAIGG